MRIGLVTDPVMLEHRTGAHPECPQRLMGIRERLDEEGWWAECDHLDCAPAEAAALERVHSTTYLRTLANLCATGGGWLTGDTPVSERSWEAATMASGAAIAAVDAVLDARVDSAFALVRPPGHHACPSQGMGFCLLNHAAVAARHLTIARGLDRVLILDFDVHHGNGTQDTFTSDPRVMYASVHQHPAYPGTGEIREVGTGAGRGTTVNVPLPADTNAAGFLAAFDQVLLPAARRFRPEFVLVSAGYDAHWSNERYLNSIRMGATIQGFAAWSARLLSLAQECCSGRLAFTLEGGYDIEALSRGVTATLAALSGREVKDPMGSPRHGRPTPDVAPILAACKAAHGL